MSECRKEGWYRNSSGEQAYAIRLDRYTARRVIMTMGALASAVPGGIRFNTVTGKIETARMGDWMLRRIDWNWRRISEKDFRKGWRPAE
ncbi:MAG: hypothetical protein LBR80_04200 [Deltaproteobacteria bacterium]|jgi:hypothetical protein|nr:hypothetical protein [Deltaproteobacteria bacterium]